MNLSIHSILTPFTFLLDIFRVQLLGNIIGILPASRTPKAIQQLCKICKNIIYGQIHG